MFLGAQRSPSPRAGVLSFPMLFLLLLFLLLLTPAPLRSQGVPAERPTIRRIRIEGLERESEASILSRLKIQVGEKYDRDRVSAETGNLYRMNKFSSVEPPEVRVLEDGVEIVFKVKERARVTRVVFQGRQQVSERRLLTEAPALQTRKGGLLNQAHVRQDLQTIREKYHEDGYVFSRVDYKIEKADGEATVIFEIEEGTRVRIRGIRFVGNKSVSAGTLMSQMMTQKKHWFFGIIHSGFYDPEILEQDLLRIEQYYQSIGYFDAEAQIESLDFGPWKEKLFVVIRIREGSPYIFQGYEFSGNAVFSSKTLGNLTAALPGQIYSTETLEEDRESIKDYYYNRAYVFAEITPRRVFELEGQDVKIRFEIDEKDEAYIEQIRIQGNPRTQDRVIRRELEFYPGEKVDWSKFEKSRSNLNRLRIFQSVDFAFEDGSSPSQKHVDVEVIEQENFGRLSLGFGVTSGGGIIGSFNVLKRNFDITDLPDSLLDFPDAWTGAGQTFILDVRPGTDISRYAVTFTEPYVFGTRNALTLQASKRTVVWEDYLEDRLTFSPQVSHAFDFDRDFVFSVGNRLSEVEIHRVEPDAPQDAQEAEGYTTIIALNTAVSYDKVLFEYLEGPYSGFAHGVRYEHGGGFLGGDIDFHKVDVTNDFYYPLYTFEEGPEQYHHVISLVNRFGVIEPHGNTDEIPIFERYYLGGAQTVRGFRFRGLGPHENQKPIGGTGMLWGNLEYSFPIFRKLLRGVAFFDYGNLAPTLADFDFSEMRYVVGGGVRINVPLPGQPFPINLYFGVPLAKEDEDRERLFLFTIGTPF